MRFYSLFSSLGLVAVLPSVGAAKADSARQFTSVSRHQPVIQKVIADQKLKKASFIEQNTVLRQRGGDNTKKDAIAGALVMTLIERATNRVLKSQGSNFPSQLGGCIALLFFMLSAEAVAPGLGDSIFVSLSPGAALLAKWLPVFFVPGLAMLPLAPSVGSSFEVQFDNFVVHLDAYRFSYEKVKLLLFLGRESRSHCGSWICVHLIHCWVFRSSFKVCTG
jgi:hypothetical protein